MRVYISEKKINIMSDDMRKRSFPLGEGTTAFVRFGLEEVNSVYNRIITAFFKTREDAADYRTYVQKQLYEMEKNCVCLCYHNEIMEEVLCLRKEKAKLADEKKYFEAIPELAQKGLRNYLKEDVSLESKNKVLSNFLPEKITFEMTDDQKAESYKSLMFFLYFRDALLFNINSAMKRAEELLSSVFSDSEDTDLSLLEGANLKIETEYLVDKNVLEVFNIENAGDFILFEILKFVQMGGNMKKCRNCGKLFVPAKRQDTLYCSFADKQTGKTCAQIGALKKFNDKVKQSPVYVEYSRVYKKLAARVRSDKMTEAQFRKWCEKARKMRDKCEMGQVDYSEFLSFLNRNID